VIAVDTNVTSWLLFTRDYRRDAKNATFGLFRASRGRTVLRSQRGIELILLSQVDHCA
jgi:hypothetical protein